MFKVDFIKIKKRIKIYYREFYVDFEFYYRLEHKFGPLTEYPLFTSITYDPYFKEHRLG